MAKAKAFLPRGRCPVNYMGLIGALMWLGKREGRNNGLYRGYIGSYRVM